MNRLFSATRKLTRDDIIREALFIVGMIAFSLAYPLFYLENNIAPGGISGIAMILNELVNVPVGLTIFLLNLPLFVLGYFMRGVSFVARSFVSMTITSFLIDAVHVGSLIDDPLMAAIAGGVLLGVGLGLIIRANATTGGTDLAASIIHKKFPVLSIGGILLTLDCIVVAGAGIVFEPRAALYSFVTLYISTTVMNRVIEGFDTALAFIIISDKNVEITQSIFDTLGRGVTLLKSKGGYSGVERDVVLCVITRTQTTRLKRIVHTIDKAAFMISADVHEAMGEGFDKLTI